MTAMHRPGLGRRAAAEGVGTAMLVFVGCGAVASDAAREGGLGVVGVGLAFFLVLLCAIAALGHVSGAHFNPGVSLGFALTRHLPPVDLAAYVAAQFAGATVGALGVSVAWPGTPGDLGVTRPGVADWRALIVEGALSAVLMLVIMSVATDTRAVGAPAALAIAAAVGGAAIAFGPVTGASMNTARSVGPALVAGEWDDLWIYVAAPLAGAPLGAFAYRFLRGENPRHGRPPEGGADGDGPVRLPA